VGGDAATEPHKTGCSGYPEEEFSRTHMDSNASILKPGEAIRRGSCREGGARHLLLDRVSYPSLG